MPGEKIDEAVRNLHDLDRQTCRLCGECDIGCNFGSKNSLDFNYLTLAVRAGAEIRTLAEVPPVHAGARRGEGYDVHVVQHPDRGSTSVRARHLVLAAGTLGSSQLLLQASRRELGGLSPRLGRGFSANGDVSTAALSTRPDGRDDDGGRLRSHRCVPRAGDHEHDAFPGPTRRR